VLLADWLIDMGLDACVVLGDFKGSGHAWVVVLDETRFFLLEPTAKHKSKRLQVNLFVLTILENDPIHSIRQLK
jgi:hypothetical protein